MMSQDCISDTNMTDGMAGDDTSGTKMLYKNFIYSEFTFTYASSDIEQMDRNVKKYSAHILKYEYILIHFIYIYVMSYKRLSMICKTISCSIFQ